MVKRKKQRVSDRRGNSGYIMPPDRGYNKDKDNFQNTDQISRREKK